MERQSSCGRIAFVLFILIRLLIRLPCSLPRARDRQCSSPSFSTDLRPFPSRRQLAKVKVRAVEQKVRARLAQIFRYINWSSFSQIIIYGFSVLEEKLKIEEKSKKVKVKKSIRICNLDFTFLLCQFAYL